MRLKKFFKEAFEELKKVDWPDRQKTGKMVAVVIIFSLSIAVVLGFFDFLFLSFITNLLL
ncbi:MAG: preprotein translocase subunit SecE [Candidatus Liptonbacteria bacterium]|nr:preprotein translocase subunit SecE [Candidatus Liptonbacteria bacterium]